MRVFLYNGPETDLLPEAWDVTEASTGPQPVRPCLAIYRIPGVPGASTVLVL